MILRATIILLSLLCALCAVAACGKHPPPAQATAADQTVVTATGKTSPGRPSPPAFIRTGEVTAAALDEISGLQAGEGGDWWVHTDDGKPEVHAIDAEGRVVGTVALEGARNRDWEDMTRVTGNGDPLLVISDSGDNEKRRKSIQLYFYPLPVRDSADRLPASLELRHRIDLHYPDGPRDCESAAYDPIGNRILLVSKRDAPPRIYGIDLDAALSQPEAELEFLGEMAKLRAPTPMDRIRNPGRGAWISQPTGMDISADGMTAAVITYRSLYLFHRGTDESWPDALAHTPHEIVGPPGFYEEAVSFSAGQDHVMVTSENLPAALYRLDLNGLFPD